MFRFEPTSVNLPGEWLYAYEPAAAQRISQSSYFEYEKQGRFYPLYQGVETLNYQGGDGDDVIVITQYSQKMDRVLSRSGVTLNWNLSKERVKSVGAKVGDWLVIVVEDQDTIVRMKAYSTNIQAKVDAFKLLPKGWRNFVTQGSE